MTLIVIVLLKSVCFCMLWKTYGGFDLSSCELKVFFFRSFRDLNGIHRRSERSYLDRTFLALIRFCGCWKFFVGMKKNVVGVIGCRS